jgi:hypothetical protein
MAVELRRDPATRTGALRRANEILTDGIRVFRRGGARPQAEVSTAVLVEYIDAHRDRFGVEPICTVLSQAGTRPRWQ